MPTHDRIDIAHWKREIPLSRLRIPGRELFIQMVYGPREIAAIEQLREESDQDRGPGTPTDICIWSTGEPANPAVTKIGGKPYRPTAAPWPTTKDGDPMGLLAQFNFTDSLDVLPIQRSDLPGDLLLVFTKGPHLYSDWDPEDESNWALEWPTLGRAPYQPPPSIPRILDMTPAWATLHRTMDYPESDIDDGVNIIEGTKFGGIPPFQQSDPELPGIHLCTLGSLNPFGNPWPMLNVPVNPKGEQYLDPDLLMIGDLGAAYFFLDEVGQVRWTADCG